MSNPITTDSLSNYEKLLIIAAREADERAWEDALNLLRSRKTDDYIVEGSPMKTKGHGITRGAEYYKSLRDKK